MPNISKKEIKKLSLLSRISVSEKETKELQEDLENILNFVSKLKKAQASNASWSTSDVGHRNVFREDETNREPGHDKPLIKQAPKTEKGYIKVKKVL